MNNKQNKNNKKNRPTFCLNMIVKNESHIILEVLENMLKYINYWVISDTGSTDGTQDMIRNFFARKKIPGELVEHKWEDFGHNRTMALKAAAGKADYIWVIDADDLIMGTVEFPRKMNADWYMLKYVNPESSFAYERQQIFSGKLEWAYSGVLHEYPICLSKETPRVDSANISLPGDYYVHSRRLGDRSKDADKYARDAKILSTALEKQILIKKQTDVNTKLMGVNVLGWKDQNRSLIPRYCFYAAQSYKDDHNAELAIKYYKRYTTILKDVFNEFPIKNSTWYNQELYYTWIQLGNLMKNSGKYSDTEITNTYMSAIPVCSPRAEAEYSLGEFYITVRNYKYAEIFLKKAAEKKYPIHHTFFIDTDIHQWKSKCTLAALYITMDKISEAKPILEKLLENQKYRDNIAIKELYDNCRYPHLEELKKEVIQYNKNIVDEITNRVKTDVPNKHKITLTITTCKRFNLFEKTMNSFINCCQDILLIDRFICIDDNSSEEDRLQMQKLYPFFEFIFKTPEQKGHLASMNMVISEVKTPYVLHMEDDFLFLDKSEYIKPALQILNQSKYILLDDVPADQNIHSKEIGQVLFNRNYQEEIESFVPGGYLAETSTKYKYIIHEHYTEGTAGYLEAQDFYKRGTSVYWPHFSFRPSILKTSVYKKLGQFASGGFFEREYADRYYANNYISTYFDKVTCEHIGRLTRERNSDKKNAYELNEEEQFLSKNTSLTGVDLDGYDFYPNLDSYGDDITHVSGKSIAELKNVADTLPNCLGFNTYGYFKSAICPRNKFIKLGNRYNSVDGIYVKKSKVVEDDMEERADLKYKTLCVNMLRRPDRKYNMVNLFEQNDITNYEFFEAVDGSKLEPTKEIQQLFLHNDFGYRKGFIGCALSHYKIWQQLVADPVNDFYLVFEDDIIDMDNNYMGRLNQLVTQMKKRLPDVLFLGYFMFPDNFKKYSHLYDKSDRENIVIDPLKKDVCIGGTFNYLVSKTGARKLLQYANTEHIRHGIDYFMKIVPGLNVCETQPHIAFSEWVQTSNSVVDSDIQKDVSVFKFDFAPESDTTYTYYDGLDSPGFDIQYIGSESVSELKYMCESNPNCIGFNTLGFMKHYIGPMTTSPYIRAGEHGLYVHVDRFNKQVNKTSRRNQSELRVKMLCNWQSSQAVCDEFNHQTKGNYEWNDIRFTYEDTDIDYWVILNKPLQNDKSYYDPSRTIVIQLEPWCEDPSQNWGVKTWGEWAEPSEDKFLHVRSHKKYPNSATWQLSATYDDLKLKSITKTKNWVSSICSSKYFDPGHIKRIDFMKYVESKNDPNIKIDIYNHDNHHAFKNYQGPHPRGLKDVGITPYKYYFMAENNQERNFITEKIWEPLLTETLCFYWGCPNVADWVDPRAYVVLDLNDFEASYQVVKSAIETDLWSDRIDIIRQEKAKVLDYYNIIPTIERVIVEDKSLRPVKKFYQENFSDTNQYQNVCFIHSCNLGDTTVLESIVNHIEKSEVNNFLDVIWIVNIGKEIQTVFSNPKIKVLQYSSNTKTFELDTINLMWKFSQTHPNTKLLYVHTKGVSYNGVPLNIQDWTNYMLYFLVDKFNTSDLQLLNTSTDTMGVNCQDKPHSHYSGNFWWSHTNYIRTLKPITSEVRHDAEWWVLSGKNVRAISMNNSNIDHYQQLYPASEYAHLKI